MNFQKMPKKVEKVKFFCQRFFTIGFEISLVKAVWILKLQETVILIKYYPEMGHKPHGKPQEPQL